MFVEIEKDETLVVRCDNRYSEIYLDLDGNLRTKEIN